MSTNTETPSEETGNAPKAPKTAPNSAAELSKTNNFQRIAHKKMVVRNYPRSKKLELLAVYSSCKVLYVIFTVIVICIRLFSLLPLMK